MNRTKRIETILEKYFGDTNISVINNSSLHKGHNNFDGKGETHILIKFYKSSEEFFKSKENQRIILMTTKASISYTTFKFDKNDTILFGRESAGVPENIHKIVKYRLKIPMKNNKRSLNIASSVAIILAESLKQTKLF